MTLFQYGLTNLLSNVSLIISQGWLTSKTSCRFHSCMFVEAFCKSHSNAPCAYKIPYFYFEISKITHLMEEQGLRSGQPLTQRVSQNVEVLITHHYSSIMRPWTARDFYENRFFFFFFFVLFLFLFFCFLVLCFFFCFFFCFVFVLFLFLCFCVCVCVCVCVCFVLLFIVCWYLTHNHKLIVFF